MCMIVSKRQIEFHKKVLEIADDGDDVGARSSDISVIQFPKNVNKSFSQVH